MQEEIKSFLAEKLVSPRFYTVVEYSEHYSVLILNIPKHVWEGILKPFFEKKIKQTDGKFEYFEYGEKVRCRIWIEKGDLNA